MNDSLDASRTIRLFVSSPGDALAERRRVEAVAARLNGEFQRRIKIVPICWEESYYSAHETFQQQIPQTADCDLVIAVFRARLGTELPDEFKKLPNGQSYPSGTAYEVLSAMEARRGGKALPDIYVFRYAKPPTIELDDPSGQAIRAEWERLKHFFDTWFCTPEGQFLAAFQNFSTTDDFADKVEGCIRQWLARQGLVEEGKVWDRVLKGPPFPGLVAYDESYEDVFFGRDLDVAHALTRLREAASKAVPFLLLIGASDAGKSSLLRAGLLPELMRPGTVPEIDLWRKVVVVPGIDPFLSLAQAMFRDDALGQELAAGDFPDEHALAKLFTAGDAEASVAPIRTALSRAASVRAAQLRFAETRPARLALGIDQAERLFLESNADSTNGFARLIAAFVKANLAYVVMALRNNAYARFQLIGALRDLRVGGAIFDVIPPGQAELEEIVVKPVAACRPPLAFEIKEGNPLAERLISDATGGDVLPLLQIALSQLFKAESGRGDGVLRYADYPGLGEAMSQTAQDALTKLDAEAKAQLPALILALVDDAEPAAGTGVIVPVVSGIERGVFERNKPARTKLIDAFIEHRLLVIEGSGDQARVRPVHEALLRIWPEAVKTIAANIAAIRARHVLRPIVREWKSAPAATRCGYVALPPALMAGARQVMELCGDDLSEDMRAFITEAVNLDAQLTERESEERIEHERVRAAEALAATERRLFRRTLAGLALVGLLAVALGGEWIEARNERRLAESQLTAAVSTANSLVSDFASRLRKTAGVPIVLVEDILERIRTFQESLDQRSPALLQSKADAQRALASTLLALGDTGKALQRAQEAQEIYSKLQSSQPENGTFLLGLSRSENEVGDVLLARGDFAGASNAYGKSAAIAQVQHGKDPANADWQHYLTEMLNKVGDVLIFQGKLPEAKASYENALEVAKSPLDAGASDNAKDRRLGDLAWSHSKMGDVYMLDHDTRDALAEYRESLIGRNALASKDENNPERRHDVWISDNKYGDALAAEDALKSADQAYRDGLAIAKSIADADNGDAKWQFALAVSLRKIGEVAVRQEKTADALAAYQQSLEISNALVARDLNNLEWKIELIQVNWALADLNDDPVGRLELVIKGLTELAAEKKITPDKADWLTRANQDREKLLAEVTGQNPKP